MCRYLQLSKTLENSVCYCYTSYENLANLYDFRFEWTATTAIEMQMPQKRMECFTLVLDHLAWVEHQFLSGIRESRKAGSLWRMMRDMGGVRESIHQSWVDKELGLGLLCGRFKGVQASTLQIGSVSFPPGHCTSPQLNPCPRLFDQDGHEDSLSL